MRWVQYMATTPATRVNPVIRTFYTRRVVLGKPPSGYAKDLTDNTVSVLSVK